MNEDNNVEQPQEEAKKVRQIIIETDGNTAAIKNAEVAGTLELIGILETLIKQIRK